MAAANRFVKPGATALAIAIALGGSYEGTRLVAYHDPGNGTPTICMGETHGVFMGMTKTLAECQVMFSGGMGQRVDFVRVNLKVSAPETRIAGLADFAYNEGEASLISSVAWKDINKGMTVEGCHALLNWPLADGKYLRGLWLRRQSECQLCLIGEVHNSLSCGESP
jgi:lysozyme